MLLLAAVALRRALPERIRVDDVAPAGGTLPDATGSLAARDLHVLARRPAGPARARPRAARRRDPRADRPERQRQDDGAARARRRAARAGTVSGDRVARTFQRDAGFPALTPYRQVLLALRATHHDERAWPVLDLVGLTERAHATELTARRARGCSQLARAVATGAPVLALDEPAVGMTAAERARLDRRPASAGGLRPRDPRRRARPAPGRVARRRRHRARRRPRDRARRPRRRDRRRRRPARLPGSGGVIEVGAARRVVAVVGHDGEPARSRARSPGLRRPARLRARRPARVRLADRRREPRGRRLPRPPRQGRGRRAPRARARALPAPRRARATARRHRCPAASSSCS